VSEREIATNPDKVTIIVSLPTPTTISEVKGFLDHTGYYRHFIHGYATITMPLTELLRKTETPHVWTSTCSHAFNALKRKLVTALILVPPNWDKDFHIYMDVSNVIKKMIKDETTQYTMPVDN
jgi:hypothetical protein